MARKVELRPSYQADSRYLSILIEAIEKDERFPPKWKGPISGLDKKGLLEYLKVIQICMIDLGGIIR